MSASDVGATDRAWLVAMAAVTAVELGCWGASWAAGFAPGPWLFTYLALAMAGLGAAVVVRTLALRTVGQRRATRASWSSVAIGTALVGVGASLFLPLKYAIPREIPFWLDGPLAAAERRLFGADPWLLLDQNLGWATLPLDRLYGAWLPVQTVILFLVMLAPPSRAKARALIAYSLGWFLLGVVAALLGSSAGPLFYERLFGGGEFAALDGVLRARGATLALAESDAMWTSLASGRPGLVAGISAFPSIHVAISAWMLLAARTTAPRLAGVALAYVILIWLGSVQLGWHYVSDGLAGVLGMMAIWHAVGAIEARAWRRRTAARRANE